MSEGFPSGSKSRVLLKLSGEILGGPQGRGIDTGFTGRVAGVLISLSSAGWQIGVVAGGGNYVRGIELTGIRRTRADYMGMLATVINGLAMQDAVEKHGGHAAVLSAIDMPGTGTEFFSVDRAENLFSSGHIVFFAGGTGNPLLTTDTAAALRASQTGCSILYKGTKVDGVYNKDPVAFADAERYTELSYQQVLEQDLRVMDAAAVAVCRENNLPIIVFDITDPSSFAKVIADSSIGTVVGEI